LQVATGVSEESAWNYTCRFFRNLARLHGAK